MNDLSVFKSELLDIIDDMLRLLSSINEEDESLKVKQTLFRHLHNIKETAGMLDLAKLESLTQFLEDRLINDTAVNIEYILIKYSEVLEKYIESFEDVALNLDFLEALEPRSNQEAMTVQASEGERSASNLNYMKKFERIPKLSQKINIAIIEDEDDLRSILVQKFENIGFAVYPFRTGHEFFESDLDLFSLILTDKNLPQMSGVEIVQKLKLTHPFLPIVVISGYLDEESLLEFGRVGVSSVIPKPFETYSLLQCCTIHALNHRYTQCLNRVYKLFGYKMGSVLFEDPIKPSDIDYLVHQYREISVEASRIKRYLISNGFNSKF